MGRVTDIILKNMGRAIVKLPMTIIRLLAGRPIRVDGQELDPIIQIMVRYFSDLPGKLASVEETRKIFDEQAGWMAHKLAPDVAHTKFTVPNSKHEIPCEIYRPLSIADHEQPVLLFFHGGGHVAGSVLSHRHVCWQLSVDAKCVVISVEYRLAPEHPFPAGINDALMVYDKIVDCAKSLGINPDRITVGGDSAGGNIAAIIAQQRKQSPHPPKCQILWAPWVDMSKQSHSYKLFATGYFLEKPKMEWFTTHYLSGGSNPADPMVSPLFGEVEDVCPAIILIAGFDPLRDEGLAYADKLKTAGVDVTVKFYEGLTHPFINIAGYIPAARIAFDDATAMLRKQM